MMKRARRFELCLLWAFAASASAQNWPAFRGQDLGGIAVNQNLPQSWTGTNSSKVIWKTPIPGLSHSSPIIWGDRVYVTTAISSRGEPELVTGDSSKAGIDSAADIVPHRWVLYSIDSRTGKVVWQKDALSAAPRLKRHRKASHASATPATDGKHIVALFGSEGLFCFDMQGKVLWNADTGLLDVGLAGDAESQWGAASSPVIHGNLVIVQNDRHANSFLAAYNLETGKQAWFTPRDEKPAWSTPAIFKGRRTEIITNGANFLRGNDPATGKELWRVSNDDSQVIVPSPVIAGDRVILTGGYPTGARPIQAIQLDSPSGLATIAWKAERGSPYTPTPLVYQGVVYALVDNGILNAYELGTGSVVYRTRVAIGAAFSASPVASDGKLYLASEDGSVYVAKAGREFSLLAQNDMGEVLMATPAISSGTLVVRGRSHLFGISSGTRR